MRQLQWKPVSVATIDDLNPASRMKIAYQIVQNFRDWKVHRRGYEQVWEAIDRHINQYDPVHTPLAKAEGSLTIDTPDTLGSKLKMSNTYKHREGIVAAMMRFLMANDYDFFDIVPMDSLDQDACDSVKQYLMDMFASMNFKKDYIPYLRDIVQYGTAVASYEWVQEKAIRWKMDRIPVDGMPDQVIRYQAEEIIYDAPKFQPLNIYRTVIDPGATDMRTATLIFQKMVTPYEMLANPAYRSLDENYVFNLPDAGADEDTVSDTLREHARGNTAWDAATAYRGKKKVYEAWGDFTDGHTLYQNYVAEVVEGRLIRFEPNPYQMPHKPFVITRFSVETGRIYGHPPLASITAIQAGFDTIVNQEIDARAMHNERPWLMMAGAVVQDKNNNKQLPPLGKNVVWKVKDMNGFQRARDEDFETFANTIPVLQFLEEQMTQATADNELNSGGAMQPYITTGQVVKVAEAGNSRFNLYASTIEEESIIAVLNITVDLLRQQMPQPRIFENKTTGSGASLEFRPEMLLNDIRFTMRGASYNSIKQLQVNAMQQFYTMLLGNPVTAQMINWVRVIKSMGEVLGIRDIQNHIAPQAEAMDEQIPEMQPSLMSKVMGLFANKQQRKQKDMMTLGQAYTQPMAPALGGSDTGSGTGALDPVSQESAA